MKTELAMMRRPLRGHTGQRPAAGARVLDLAPVSGCIADKRLMGIRLESCFEAAAICGRPGGRLLGRLRSATADYCAAYGAGALSLTLWDLRAEVPVALFGAAITFLADEDLSCVLMDLEGRCRTGRDRAFHLGLCEFVMRDTTEGEYDLDWDIEDVVGELVEAVEGMECRRPETVRLLWSRGTEPLDAELRMQALDLLPLGDVPELVAVLQEEAGCKDVAVRRGVARRLKELRSMEALGIAGQLMDDGDVLVRRDAEIFAAGFEGVCPVYPAAVAEDGFWVERGACAAAGDRPLFVATASHEETYSYAVLRFSASGERLMNAWGNAGVTGEVFAAFKEQWSGVEGNRSRGVGPVVARRGISVARGRIWADMAVALFPAA